MYYVDNCIIGGGVRVYPGVLHLLCRWHVDQYVNLLHARLHKHNHAYIYRAWQKKLHASVHDDGHKAEIYKYLWMLMTEGDPTVFQKKPGGISNILGKEGARIHFLLQRLLCQQSW